MIAYGYIYNGNYNNDNFRMVANSHQHQINSLDRINSINDKEFLKREAKISQKD